jgi:acetate kinase
MDKVAYMYALPYEWYTEHKVRKYGAHGTSHKFLANRANEILGRTDTKIITCHIGNGSSICAVKNGKCVDTSMGFTPNAGLVMCTRCGDVDVSIIPYMMNRLNLSPKDVDTIINKQSGMSGVSGLGADAREVEDGANRGEERAVLAQNMVIRSIVNYIARYYVLMGGADAIVFSGGIGENSWDIRKGVIDSLAVLGIKIDDQANDHTKSKEILISAPDSTVPVYIIPTDEEIMIARETLSYLK